MLCHSSPKSVSHFCLKILQARQVISQLAPRRSALRAGPDLAIQLHLHIAAASSEGGAR